MTEKKTPRKDSKESDHTPFGQATLALMIPGLMLAGPLVGYGLGYLIMKVFNTGDIIPIIFLFLGFLAGIRESIIIVKKIYSDTR